MRVDMGRRAPISRAPTTAVSAIVPPMTACTANTGSCRSASTAKPQATRSVKIPGEVPRLDERGTFARGAAGPFGLQEGPKAVEDHRNSCEEDPH